MSLVTVFNSLIFSMRKWYYWVLKNLAKNLTKKGKLIIISYGDILFYSSNTWHLGQAMMY